MKENKKEIALDQKAKNKLFWMYVALMAISLTFLFISSTAVKVVGFCGLIAAHLLYLFKVNSKDVFGWIYFFIFTVYEIIYVASIFKEFVIGVITLYLAIIYLISLCYIILTRKLTNSKAIVKILLSYILLAFTVILLFSTLYIALSSIQGHNVLVDGEAVKDIKSLFFFSSEVFYNNTFNEAPLGWSQLIAQLELMCSFIIHIFLLARVINALREEKK